MKVLPSTDIQIHDKIKKPVPLLPNGQKLLLKRDGSSGKSLVKYRRMTKDDPWYIPKKQRKLRDYPPRRWPPVENVEDNNSLLPTDGTLWDDEVYKDQNFHAEYFLTNLYSGDLSVNGMHISKGAVAGPLPRFAIIESEGGQISFWFGVYGRHYMPGNSHVNQFQDESSKWETLRAMVGEWEFVGMKSAQVWNLKMDHRWRRERTGISQDDDDEWECWKKGLPYGGCSPSLGELQRPIFGGSH
jgi:hypothetical protein